MSSNQQIKKICQHCNEMFIAQKATTKFCSLRCAQRNYKLREKKERIKKSNDNNIKIIKSGPVVKQEMEVLSQTQLPSELINIKTLSSITNISERTLFYLIKEEEDFPKLKIGRSLLFHKQTVVNYLINKYGNL
jgi:predicted DNA-binding transcriptional regulator AlpA